MQYPFEPAARRGEDPPEELDPPEILLYERLRTIYALLALGRIDMDSAQTQKHQAEKRYREMSCYWKNCERMTDNYVRTWRELEALSNAYRKHDRDDLAGLVSLADKMLDVVYFGSEATNENQT